MSSTETSATLQNKNLIIPHLRLIQNLHCSYRKWDLHPPVFVLDSGNVSILTQFLFIPTKGKWRHKEPLESIDILLHACYSKFQEFNLKRMEHAIYIFPSPFLVLKVGKKKLQLSDILIMSHVALRSKLQRKEESYKAFGFKLTFKDKQWRTSQSH